MKGYVAAWDPKTGGRFLHHTQSATVNTPGRRDHRMRDPVLASDKPIEELFPGLPPKVKRTPHQRIESLTKRLLVEAERHRKVFGFMSLPEEILREIEGEYWKVGTPITVHDLRRIAMHLLEQAERRDSQAQAKRVTRTR